MFIYFGVNNFEEFTMPVITFEAGQLSALTDISLKITGIPKLLFFISTKELPDENIAEGGKTVVKLKKELGRI